MTTTEAFLQVTSKRGWYKDLGISEGAGNSLLKRVRDGEKFSQDKIEEILIKAGYFVEQEKQWCKKSKIENLVDLPEELYGQQEWLDLHAHMFAPGTLFVEKAKAMDIYYQKLKAINEKPKSIIEKLLEAKEI